MKNKTYLITIAIATFALGPLLRAQESNQSQSAALAEELLSLMNVQKDMDKEMNTIFQQLSKISDQLEGVTPEATKSLPEIKAAITKKMTAMLNWETIKPQFISIYSEIFTPEELQGMIAFYKIQEPNR
jgi:hypothetical protein